VNAIVLYGRSVVGEQGYNFRVMNEDAKLGQDQASLCDYLFNQIVI
jgi:hypothetical protein